MEIRTFYLKKKHGKKEENPLTQQEFNLLSKIHQNKIFKQN